MIDDYYLAMFDARGRCMRVVKSKNIRELKHMALEGCTGRKSMAICDSTEQIVWACHGSGLAYIAPHIYYKEEPDSPIGKILKGVSL